MDTNKITKFDTRNSDLITQLIFDDNMNTTTLRIMKLLTIPKRLEDGSYQFRRLFSQRGIAKMIGMSLTATHEALKRLLELGMIEIVQGYVMLGARFTVPKAEQNRSESGTKVFGNQNQSVPNTGHNIYKEYNKEVDKECLPKNNKFKTFAQIDEEETNRICDEWENEP